MVPHDVNVGEVGAQALNGGLVHVGLGADYVEGALAVEAFDDMQPQLAAGNLACLCGTFLSCGKHGAGTVAVRYVGVDYGSRCRIGVDDFLGIDGHEYALAGVGVVDKLVDATEGVHFHAAQTHALRCR